ncbi:NACHT domain-containing protein [Glycomyces scopariae]
MAISPFGLKLRTLRERAGLYQIDLANLSGHSERTIRRYETQNIKPTHGTVERLADALKLPMHERAELFALAGITIPGQTANPFADEIFAAAKHLADMVSADWQKETEQRKVGSPRPLPVRWRMAEDLTDHWRNVFGTASGPDPDPLDLSGALDRIAAVYQRIPSKRLVVVGRTGSGKTVLAMSLVRGLLDVRKPTDPVPVVVALESWKPSTDFRDWLASQLLRDYIGLRALLPDGTTLAAALVQHGLVLPVLDGFDEIAPLLRERALERLNDLSPMPMVLTSRADEFRRAAAGKALTTAPCIEIDDLTVDDLARYLPSTTHKKTGQGLPLWDPVIHELRYGPRTVAADAVAAVFTTPLMVSLARTVYSDNADSDPAELFIREHFSGSKAVESHLLASLVPLAYRHELEGSRFETERVEHWLGHLARHLKRINRRGFAWWEIGTSMSRLSRALVMTLVLGLVFATADIAVIGTLTGASTLQLLLYVVVDLAAAASVGVAHGLLSKGRSSAFEPSTVRIRLRGKTTRPPGELARRFRAGFAAGALVGLGFMVVREVFTGFVLDRDPLLVLKLIAVNGVVLGGSIGLGAGIVFVLLALCERPLDHKAVQTPADLIRANRRTVLAQALAAAPVLAVLAMLVVWGVIVVLQMLPPVLGEWTWDPLFGLVVGGYLAAMGAVGFALGLTAWGRWIVFGRFWLPLTGRLPWALPEFLDDAYRRGVLRRSGVVYQFRHARLRDHFAGSDPEPEPGPDAAPDPGPAPEPDPAPAPTPA